MAKLYVYESCVPIVQITTKKTQIIQTEKLVDTNIIGTIVKDVNNYCWTYLGEFENTYIPPTEVFSISYSGNFFKQEILPVFQDTQSCLITQIKECVPTFYNAKRCDNNLNVVVSICDYGVENSTIKFLPNIGQICGVYNSEGDDFCVSIVSQTSYTETNFEIVTPIWYDFDCSNCPLYKSYIVSSCNQITTGITVYDLVTSETIDNGKIILIDNVCYIVDSYNGVVCDYKFNSVVFPTFSEGFETCEECFIKVYNK